VEVSPFPQLPWSAPSLGTHRSWTYREFPRALLDARGAGKGVDTPIDPLSRVRPAARHSQRPSAGDQRSTESGQVLGYRARDGGNLPGEIEMATRKTPDPERCGAEIGPATCLLDGHPGVGVAGEHAQRAGQGGSGSVRFIAVG